MIPNCPPPAPIVVLVEDEALLRIVARDMLEDGGFAVIDADTADEALGILESRSDIDVLFTDFDMPGTMDGLALADQVRRSPARRSAAAPTSTRPGRRLPPA